MPLPTGCYANARRWAACKRSSGVKSVATLHLMVGLPCSGKTTLAKQLEQERSALRLTPDEWQVDQRVLDALVLDARGSEKKFHDGFLSDL